MLKVVKLEKGVGEQWKGVGWVTGIWYGFLKEHFTQNFKWDTSIDLLRVSWNNLCAVNSKEENEKKLF